MLSKFSSQILVFDQANCDVTLLLIEAGAREELLFYSDNLQQAKAAFEKSLPQVVIVVVAESSRAHELEFINWLSNHRSPTAIIAATPTSNPEVTAAAIRSGASDFFNLNTSGSSTSQLLAERILRAVSQVAIRTSVDEARKPLNDTDQPSYIGSSQKMVEVAQLIVNAAKSNASVFITGENGTGKEVCAQLIHRFSARSDDELVTLNCAAIPDSLAETELFGHVKGAFTGAINDRQGVARQADNGTLFLDEIGEMAIDTQSKLLRFVQTGYFNRVGSNQIENVDVRFICATNRDPMEQIQSGKFRQDLFYRLNVIQIHLPPLRERGDDIVVLAERFLAKFSQEEGKRFTRFSPETIDLLKVYSWPGNIRELQNVIRNIVVLHDEEIVLPSMLPIAIIKEQGERRAENLPPQNSSLARQYKMIDQIKALNSRAANAISLNESIDAEANRQTIRPLGDIIDESIKEAIDLCEGNVAEASQRLGISASTVYRKLKG